MMRPKLNRFYFVCLFGLIGPQIKVKVVRISEMWYFTNMENLIRLHLCINSIAMRWNLGSKLLIFLRYRKSCHGIIVWILAKKVRKWEKEECDVCVLFAMIRISLNRFMSNRIEYNKKMYLTCMCACDGDIFSWFGWLFLWPFLVNRKEKEEKGARKKWIRFASWFTHQKPKP